MVQILILKQTRIFLTSDSLAKSLGIEVIKNSCSIQLRMKFILLINVKILTFVSRVNITSPSFKTTKIIIFTFKLTNSYTFMLS